MTWLLVISSATPLAACGCPTFAETRVIEGAGAPGGTDEIQAALDEFASWTSREGVCVAEIIARTDLRDDVLGVYRGSSITIDPTRGDVRETTLHELCHAWDAMEGHVSLDHTDLFRADDIPSFYLDLDLTEEQRVKEAFALECEQGPIGDEPEALVAELCGIEPAASDWVRDNVFDAWTSPDAWPMRTSPAEVTRTPLFVGSASENFAEAVPAGESIAMLRGVPNADGTTYTATVLLIDPATATVTAELPIPPIEPTVIGLFGSDGAPVLWATQPTRAWRLDPTDGTATALPLPELATPWLLDGYVRGETAWIKMIVPDESVPQPFALDLVTGAVSAVPVEDLPAYFGLLGSGDRVTVQHDDVVATWSFATGEWGPEVELPGWAGDGYRPLSDGRLVTFKEVGWREDVRILPVVIDPADGAWTFPEAGCAAADLTWPVRTLTLGDAIYVVEQPDDEDEDQTWELIRITM